MSDPEPISLEARKQIDALRMNPPKTRLCQKCRTPVPFGSIIERTIYSQGADRPREIGVCPDCARSIDADMEKGEEIARKERARNAEEAVAQGMGRRYRDATAETFLAFCGTKNGIVGRDILAAARRGESLVIKGPTGTGKTFAVAVIFKEAAGAGRSVGCFPVSELCDQLRSHSHAHASTGLLIEEIRRTDLLILDDLGLDKQTEFIQSEMTRVLDWRWRDGGQTVVTTNVDLKQLRESYGGRLLSRLAGLVGKNAFSMVGGDRRLDQMMGKTEA